MLYAASKVNSLRLSDLIWNTFFVLGILLLRQENLSAVLIGLGVLAFFDLIALGVRIGYVGYENRSVVLYWPNKER